MSESVPTNSKSTSECLLMVVGILRVFRITRRVQRLVDADYNLEMSRNKELRESSSSSQAEWRDRTEKNVEERLNILRRNTTRSFVFLASAVAVIVFSSLLVSGAAPSPQVWLGIASIFFFAWATLARLGWSGASWSGDTVVERLDSRFFWLLYWLGTSIGTAALVG